MRIGAKSLIFLFVALSLGFSAVTRAANATDNLFSVRVIAPTIAYPGETVNMFIETTYNGTLVGNATSVTFGAHIWVNTAASDGVFERLSAPTNFATGHYNDTWTIPSNATIGSVEWIHMPGTYKGITPSVSSTGVAGITIVSSSSVQGASSQGSTASSLSTTDSALLYAAIVIAVVAIIISALSMRRRSNAPTAARP